MQLVDSLEVRWFLADADPALAIVQRWFSSVEPEPHRIDNYLLTGRSDLGIKTRSVHNEPTKLETKYLAGSLGLIELAPGVRGNLERWRKLSSTLEDSRRMT